MVCKNIKELRKALQEKIDIALLTDVADVVSDVMTDHIAQDVYDAYEPTQYIRRYSPNGLLDPSNITSYVDEHGLVVENNTLGSKYYYIGRKQFVSQNYNKEIAGVIETGEGYDIHDWEYDDVPRPFMQNSRDDIVKNHYHTKALKQGLERQGLVVK